MTDAREVLSALIDREPVDPDVLARVLEDPDGRAMLVDFVRVRAAVNADDDGEATLVQAPGGSHGLAPGPTLQAPVRSRGSGWVRAAAVFLLLAAGAGVGAWAESYLSRERPPEPDRVVRLEPVTDAQRTAVAGN